MRLPRVSDLPSTRIQVGISGTKDAYSSNFDATFGARLCGLCAKFGACPRRYEPPAAMDRACIGSYEPHSLIEVTTCGPGPSNAPEACPGALAGLPEPRLIHAKLLETMQKLHVDPDVLRAARAVAQDRELSQEPDASVPAEGQGEGH